MKKTIAFALSFILLFSIAASAADARSATETARALVPEGSVYLYTEKDGKAFEVHFLIEATGEEFEVSVPADDSKPIKIETENAFAFGSAENTITDESIRLSVLNEYPDAQIDSFFTVKDDGLFETHVFFTSPDRFGRVKLNAETGEIIGRKLVLSAPYEGWQAELDDDYYKLSLTSESAAGETAPSSLGSASSASSFISVSQAKSAVTSRHPGAKITEIELDFEGGKHVFEGEAYLNGREYDFKVDAVTGSLIKWKLDD